MNVCVLIPAYNESKTIAELVKGVKAKGLHVVVVDDGSVDNTALQASEAGAVVLSNQRNQGKGATLQKGFQYVVDNNYDGVVCMDGDGQHAVEDLDQFLGSSYVKTDTVINGNRMADSRRMPFVRLWTNRFMSFLISSVCRQKVPDTQCGFRYIGREVLKKIHLTSGCYEIESEILIKSAKNGFAIHSVPIKTIYQGEASHIRPVRDTIRFFTYLVKEVFSKP